MLDERGRLLHAALGFVTLHHARITPASRLSTAAVAASVQLKVSTLPVHPDRRLTEYGDGLDPRSPMK